MPAGLHFLAAEQLPADLTGLRIPRREGMKLQEIGLYAVDSAAAARQPRRRSRRITGAVAAGHARQLAAELRTRTLPHERRVLGKAADGAGKRTPVAALSRSTS